MALVGNEKGKIPIGAEEKEEDVPVKTEPQ